MKKLIFFALTFIFTAAGAGLFADDGEKNTVAKESLEAIKALNMEKPAPEEKSRMDREEQQKRLEESGFNEAITDDDTLQEMAGDTSETRWEFD